MRFLISLGFNRIVVRNLLILITKKTTVNSGRSAKNIYEMIDSLRDEAIFTTLYSPY